jgi:starch synthase
VAAENGAVPHGKVGGIGDVVRDLPVALADEGWIVTVIVPAYGFLHKEARAKPETDVKVRFAGRTETAELYKVPAGENGIAHLLVEHPLLSPDGPGNIYCDDGPATPFATDATKFAFFCTVVATWLTDGGGQGPRPDIVHLHDWHAAFILLLREFAPGFQELKKLRCVFTIHNLALQGIRPLADNESSLESWFPDLDYDPQTVGDPRYADCINPMALAIKLADKVNTVSPTYAREICLPDNPAIGFHGGEGLEQTAREAAADDRLAGILNGCFYPSGRRPSGWRPLQRLLRERSSSADRGLVIGPVLKRFSKHRPTAIVTSIGRFTSQKVELFLQPVATAPTALDAILRRLGDQSLFIMLGSGDPQLEIALANVAERNSNMLLVEGYDEALAALMYDCGDLFLMPSSFEPCGISQMLAMRAGQPCVVHGVGGLRDTVEDGDTGFVFEGSTVAEQATAFVTAFDIALTLREKNPDYWRTIRASAAARRFSWSRSARDYIRELYVSTDTQSGDKTGAGHS